MLIFIFILFYFIGYYYYTKSSPGKTADKRALLDLKKKSESIDESKPPKEATKSPLDTAMEHKAEGNDYFKKGIYDKAIACYTKAIEECPKDNVTELATFYQNRAAAYDNLKKYSAVIEDCTKALNLKATYTKALYRRARAYEALKEWSDCLDDISAVCMLQSFQDQGALIMADRVLKELGKKHSAEAMANREPITPSKYFIKTYFLSFSEDPAYNLISSDKSSSDGEVRGFLKAKRAFLSEHYDEIIPACTEEIDSSESDSQFKFEALLLRGKMMIYLFIYLAI